MRCFIIDSRRERKLSGSQRDGMHLGAPRMAKKYVRCTARTNLWVVVHYYATSFWPLTISLRIQVCCSHFQSFQPETPEDEESGELFPHVLVSGRVDTMATSGLCGLGLFLAFSLSPPQTTLLSWRHLVRFRCPLGCRCYR